MENNDTEILNDLIKELYNTDWNFSRWNNNIDFNNKKLQSIFRTPSKHKNLIKAWTLTNCWYLTVKLTSLWIRYFENWFKFDSEIKEKQNFNIKTFNNNWNLSLNNSWTQDMSLVENDIDKIIDIINEKNIKNKDNIEKLLLEFKGNQDKSKLIEVFNILWSSSSVWSLILSIISMLGN